MRPEVRSSLGYGNPLGDVSHPGKLCFTRHVVVVEQEPGRAPLASEPDPGVALERPEICQRRVRDIAQQRQLVDL